MTIKTKYEALRKKHKNLPDYNKINKEFEISTIDMDDFLLREIRRKIVDKVKVYSCVLENLLSPEGSIISANETGAIDAVGKDFVIKTFNILVKIDRTALLVSLDESDKLNVDFIAEVYSQWEGIKSNLAQIFAAMNNSWEEIEGLKEKVEYFG